MMRLYRTQRALTVLQCTAPGNIDVDVSINDDRGIRAARWLGRCQARWPAMRPLTLLLKAVLRTLELHDVSQGGPAVHHLLSTQYAFFGQIHLPPLSHSLAEEISRGERVWLGKSCHNTLSPNQLVLAGGLGSFSLSNMVIAHLQEEEKVRS